MAATNPQNMRKNPLVLVILDGWGSRENAPDNAITHAHTPVLDELYQTYPHTLVDGSGPAVGLPEGQMGNSEVGHMNLGAGRIVYQDFTRISKAIEDGTFFDNPALVQGLDKCLANEGTVHILGLLSPGGVHSHEDHLLAMVKMAHDKGAKNIQVHAFLDGRDTPPRSALASIEAFETAFAKDYPNARFASLCGRYFAMDRDNRWDRVEQAWRLLTEAQAAWHTDTAAQALALAYGRDESDEFVQPSWIQGNTPIKAGDAVFFMNFRADRARELSHCFLDQSFEHFGRNAPKLSAFVMLTEYEAGLETQDDSKQIFAPVAFPPEPLTHVFGEWLEKQGKTQLRISETEKYAHVTFFFSGGREQTFQGEKRILIPSPDVATYDLQPEMNSAQLTDALVEAIRSGEYDAIICNYPNGDMVGHTGHFKAAVKACEAVDTCIGRILKALKAYGGEALITADHGNAEQMSDAATGQPHTAHTSNLVPFIYIGREAQPREGGRLSDVAPTMLHLMGLPQPPEMTGKTIMTLTNHS